MSLQTLGVAIWFTLLAVVLVLLYFYQRDRKARRTIVKEKVKQAEEKTDSGKGYTVVINEDGSVQVVFGDGEAGERLPSGTATASASYSGSGKEGEPATGKTKVAKVFANRNQMIKFLGGTITCDLPEMIPDEKGTYVVILYVWKNDLTMIEKPEGAGASLGALYKECKSCGTQNGSDALYCKKCGKQLN